MNTHIDPKLASDPELAAAVQQATTILETVIGTPKAVPLPQVEWGPEHDDQGQPRLRLLLSDSYGEVVDRFSPDELEAPYPFKMRLFDLWDDLLKIRINKSLEEARGLLDWIKRERIAQD